MNRRGYAFIRPTTIEFQIPEGKIHLPNGQAAASAVAYNPEAIILHLLHHSSPAAFSPIKICACVAFNLAPGETDTILPASRALLYTHALAYMRVCVHACLNICKSHKVYFVTSIC